MNCDCGKVCYRTYGEAMRVLAARRKGGTRQKGTAYQCPLCGMYHHTRK